MTSRQRTLLALILFPIFICLLITVLRPVAMQGWLGPVPARNLEDGFNAGALFYTEVNLEEHRTREAANPGHLSRDMQ